MKVHASQVQTAPKRPQTSPNSTLQVHSFVAELAPPETVLPVTARKGLQLADKMEPSYLSP